MLFKRQKNKRRNPRKAYGAPATVLYDNHPYPCVIENISKGGALVTVQVRNPIGMGKIVEIAIPFSDGLNKVKKMSKVVRINGDTLALKFLV
jgi:hypothetical protein